MTRLSELRISVLTRDKQCIAALLDKSHDECRDRFGEPHDPRALVHLTLEHVREEPGGMRRDEPGWCIALCHSANLAHWSSANAVAARSYLHGIRRAA